MVSVRVGLSGAGRLKHSFRLKFVRRGRAMAVAEPRGVSRHPALFPRLVVDTLRVGVARARMVIVPRRVMPFVGN